MSVRRRKWITRKREEKEAWVVDRIDGNGKRHLKTFKLKKDADAYVKTMSPHVRIIDSKETVASAAKAWLESSVGRDLERTTVNQYRQHIDLHIVPRIGRVKLAKLTTEMVEGFRDQLVTDISRPLARKVMVSLRSLLKANKAGHIGHGVTVASSKRKERHERHLDSGKDYPTPAEVRRLIEAASGDIRMHALILLAAFTGLRASELRGLRWQDVDREHHELKVHQRADRYRVIGPPKTTQSRRKIPLAGDVVKVLNKWWLKCPKGEADLVFPTADATVEHHTSAERRLEALMRKAHVVTKDDKPKAKYAWHAFRHFYASWLINDEKHGGRGMSIKTAQTLLGHASARETLDRYGHMFPLSNDRTELDAALRVVLGN
jgi:integrase